jgi:competence protein ComGC
MYSKIIKNRLKERKLSHTSFTLIEMIIVLAIIIGIVAILIAVLKPSKMLQGLRDTQRIADLKKIVDSITYYETENYGLLSFYGTPTLVYISLPDTDASCSSWLNQLPTLPIGYGYRCSATPTNIDGTGWIPINFSASSLVNLQKLPIDPINKPPYYYTYVVGGSYELTALMERDTNKGPDSIAGKDGGTENFVYEVGTNKNITPFPVKARGEPLQGLVGWWTFDEGNGTTAYDYSGNNNNGTIYYGKDEKVISHCDDLNNFSSNMVLATSSFLCIYSCMWNGYSVSASSSLASANTDYYIKYDEPGTWDFSSYSWFNITYRFNYASSSFNYARVYICDNNNNCGYFNLKGFAANTDYGSWPWCCDNIYYTLGSYDGNNGSNPNLSSVDYIKIVANPNTDLSNLNIKIDRIRLYKTATGPTWQDGKINKTLYFNSRDAYVTVPATSSFDITDALTISAWVKMDWYGFLTSAEHIVYRGYGICYRENYQLTTEFKYGQIYFCISDGTKEECAGGNYLYDSYNKYPPDWVHFVGVTSKSLGKVLLYKNGVLVASTTRTIDNISTNSSYKIWIASGCRNYPGLIDDVRIYNRALSADEIKALYDATK